MYVPPYFAQTDPTVIEQFLKQNSFALLVSSHLELPVASHLPLLFDPMPDRPGVLWGHTARANDHWKQLQGPVLAVFSGPHAYVSPAWYDAEQVVPTWNYAAVHVHGQLSLIESLDESLEILKRLVEFYENSMPAPWTFDTGDDWSRRLASGIVAFRINITSIEGKWKMSQNQPPQRRQRVIDALESRGDDQSLAVAEIMRQTRTHPPGGST